MKKSGPKKIKLFEPISGTREMRAVARVLTSGFWASGAGTGNVKMFEKKFQNYIKAKSCVAVNSGTAALHLAMSLADVRGKEVILPSLSFVSTAHCAVYNGAKPIFADVNPDTLCIDPESVSKKISDKTKAILPVHFAGMPSDILSLSKIARDSKLMLIEDAAHACGAKFMNGPIGSHGDLVCFSFHPVKNLAMPTGGLVAINHKKFNQMKEILLARRWCGITDRKEAFYDIKEIGWNYYMNEFSAAIGLVQLEKLEKLNKKRERIARKYHKELNIERRMPINNDCSYHFYWILVKNRNEFRKKMSKKGIETGIHYTPIHTMSMFRSKIKLPITEEVGSKIVTLPTHPNLSEDDMEIVISSVNKFAT